MLKPVNWTGHRRVSQPVIPKRFFISFISRESTVLVLGLAHSSASTDWAPVNRAKSPLGGCGMEREGKEMKGRKKMGKKRTQVALVPQQHFRTATGRRKKETLVAQSVAIQTANQADLLNNNAFTLYWFPFFFGCLLSVLLKSNFIVNFCS